MKSKLRLTLFIISSMWLLALGTSQGQAADSRPYALNVPNHLFYLPLVLSDYPHKIAFINQEALWTINEDASNLQQLTFPSQSESLGPPSWSPDGRQLVFVGSYPEQQMIYTIQADGSDIKLIFAGSPIVADPKWSPDGAHIAFADQIPGESSSNLLLINPIDSMATSILTAAGTITGITWSPDSSHLAYSLKVPNEKGAYLYVTPLQGSPQLLSPNLYQEDYLPNKSPTWSPDGVNIAFIRQNGEGSSLFIIHSDGSGLTELTPDMGDGPNGVFMIVSSPSWSPDGQQIVVVGLGGPISLIEFLRIEADGSGWNIIPKPGWWATEVMWAPLANRLVIGTQTAHFAQDLFVVDPDGSNSVYLGKGENPVWQP